jgi:hypothetical protein
MKNLVKYFGIFFVFLVLISTLISLNNNKKDTGYKIDPLSNEELKEWSCRNDTILRKDSVVAVFDHYEYEYNPNHKNKIVLTELCFIQIDDEPDNTYPLIKYSMHLHPDSKVQVSFPKRK